MAGRIVAEDAMTKGWARERARRANAATCSSPAVVVLSTTSGLVSVLR
jgi:hypothetical protein